MTHITVSDEQARLISEASTPIVFVDVRGRELGKLDQSAARAKSAPEMSDEELAEIKRRMQTPGPGKPTKELLEHLMKLAPIDGP